MSYYVSFSLFEASVGKMRGKELAVLTAGCCWNERILAGARAKQTERLVPITSCEAGGATAPGKLATHKFKT